MGDLILRSLADTLSHFFDMLVAFLPRVLVMLIVVALGLLVAWVLKFIVRRGLELVRFRHLSDRTGVTRMLNQAAMPGPVDLVSRLVFWVVWLVFILLGVDALEVPALHEQITRLIMFLPQIFVALLIVFVGLLAANFCARATLLAAANANYPAARLLSGVVRLLIAILAVTMAFEQLGVGQRAILIAFAIAFGAVMLGLALAFGLGGRDAARRLLEREFSKDKKETEEEVTQL